ncbi:MAG: tetratricopeptide repeat protein [Thermodesulfobacteriota bacterium]|nr:tetratricopeptide repeat protein [Thermodesulfobacteriota bacterium]
MNIEIDVRTLFEFTGIPVPDKLLPLADLEKMVREQFSFLPKPFKVKFEGWKGIITYPEESPAARKESRRLQKKAAQRAAQGNYDKAVNILKRTLELEPSNYNAKRDLAMILVEKGEPKEAKNQLIEVLGVDPDDVWGLVVLANIYDKFEKNYDVAERMLKRALQIDEDDPWAINSLGVVCMNQRRVSEAIDLFNKCIAKKPSFPNPYMGMSMAQIIQGNLEEAKQTLEKLFKYSEEQDSRSLPVFAQARKIYGELMSKLVKKKNKDMWKVIEDIKKELSDISGYPVLIQAGNNPRGTMAVIQMAWKHGRKYHLIIHKKDIPDSILIHLIAHELEHLRMECAARKAGRNRYLVTTSANQEKANRSMAKDVIRWQRKGFSEKSISDVTYQLSEGIVRQVQNAPIDLIIEAQLYRNLPLLRESQFISLGVLEEQAKESIINSKIQESMPKHIIHASSALNGATALFLDKLWEGATNYTSPYRKLDSFPTSQKLLSILEKHIKILKPGDEYDIVDMWAKILNLQGWYEWQEDTELHKASGKINSKGTTNPELLKKKHPATVWYLLDALERFDGMTKEEIKALSFEIGMLGSSGLDYASPDQKYTLKNCPGEKFSGLQLMCLMYAGFNRFAPERNLGMDLEEPFRAALQLYEMKKGKSK